MNKTDIKIWPSMFINACFCEWKWDVHILSLVSFVRSFFALHCPLLLAEKGENFKSYFELKMENKVERVRTWWEKYYWIEKDLLYPLLFLSLAVVASWDCCLCCSCCCYWLFFLLLCKWQKRVAFFGLVVERRELCVFCCGFG